MYDFLIEVGPFVLIAGFLLNAARLYFKRRPRRPEYDAGPVVNPFAQDTWNMTEQMRLFSEQPGLAMMLATAAGAVADAEWTREHPVEYGTFQAQDDSPFRMRNLEYRDGPVAQMQADMTNRWAAIRQERKERGEKLVRALTDTTPERDAAIEEALRVARVDGCCYDWKRPEYSDGETTLHVDADGRETMLHITNDTVLHVDDMGRALVVPVHDTHHRPGGIGIAPAAGDGDACHELGRRAASPYAYKCRRWRGTGPTPCLCCIGKCVG